MWLGRLVTWLRETGNATEEAGNVAGRLVTLLRG